jgi:hypothetical protein
LICNATSEQLSRIDEILRQLDQSPLGSDQANRRRTARVKIHTAMSAVVVMHSGNLDITIFTRNISTSGIGFVCRRFCKIGERVALFFVLPDRSPKMVLAQVTFARYVRGGMYEAGAEFIECIAGSTERDIPVRWSHAGERAPAPAPVPSRETPPPTARRSRSKMFASDDENDPAPAPSAEFTGKTAPENKHDPAPAAHNAGNSSA